MGREPGQTFVVDASAAHVGTVVFLHGLGDTGAGWASTCRGLRLPHLKFICPSAPKRPITLNGGMEMPGWFDIASLQDLVGMLQGKGIDTEGINESIALVKNIIDAEVAAGIPHDKIVIAGFSQGGHIALKAGLVSETKLGGIVALSTWMEPPTKLPVKEANLATPIFQGHGTADMVVPHMLGQNLETTLESMGATRHESHVYPGMQHSSSAAEMDDLRDWLLKVLPERTVTSEDIGSMSVKELKAFIRSRGGSFAGLLEKPEFVDAARRLL